MTENSFFVLLAIVLGSYFIPIIWAILRPAQRREYSPPEQPIKRCENHCSENDDWVYYCWSCKNQCPEWVCYLMANRAESDEYNRKLIECCGYMLDQESIQWPAGYQHMLPFRDRSEEPKRKWPFSCLKEIVCE